MFQGAEDKRMSLPPAQTKIHADAQRDSRWADAAHAADARRESNVLEHLKSNIDKLEEMHRRLQFMLGEIKGLIRR
ncbi:MAG TPA: hypothetical protein VFV50_16230 [Bdellovibrionales bacterium]|nr:hypothetical protein [Bdellovibrionales bacterium]